jgi:hypothetical protein
MELQTPHFCSGFIMEMSPAALKKRLETALSLLRGAIDLLDEANAPGHIAAQVDLAAHQLESLVALNECGDVA